MNILFLGPERGTTQHRIDAMRRMGHTVTVIFPDRFVPAASLMKKLHFETGGALCEGQVASSVMLAVGDNSYDLVWVEGGRYVGPQLIKKLRDKAKVIINFNHDDPFGKRDRYSWTSYRRSVPCYDMLIVPRAQNVIEAQARGAKRVHRIYMTADEVAHAPRPLTDQDHAKWDSDICFVGTWMPERGPFLAELLALGVPLAIYGNRWQRAPEWAILQSAWRGPATTNDDDYAKAIQCAKVCLGILSKGNRDDHTTRTMEVPLLGSVLCAERTPEHEALYCDGKEAVFWSDAPKCASVCLALLADDERRSEIALAGQRRCIANGHLNKAMLENVFHALGLATA